MTTIAIHTTFIPPAFVNALSTLGKVTQRGQTDFLNNADIVVTTSLEPLTEQDIAALPSSVKLVANAGIGIDHIDVDALRRKQIQLSNTPVVTEDTADLTMSLLLDVMRKTSYCDRKLRTDGWQMGFTAHKVTGKTLGIIGMGNIGAAVAQRAKGFDMNILYWGPRRKPDAEAKYQAKYCETLEELTEQSDIISLHCPLTEATHHILDAHGIAKLKPGKTIINTGRGALIDETALVERLMVGDIFAGLDVFEHEPAVPTELLTLDNVVLTPHIGSATLECRLQIAQCVVANIQHFISHGKPIHSALD